MSQVLALYARVSSDRQAQEGTIESQLEQLYEYAKEQDYEIQRDLVFIDNGVSGASLIRPGLEALRDKAFAGTINKILILCPDRLARKYAHQLILVEEFEKLGVEIIFANRQLSSSPEDQLLFQIQGVIAEFEREKIMERSRRGKLYKARQGKVAVMSCAPYGYVYIRATEHQDARWEIHEEEAKIVRRIFTMCADEGLRLWRIMKILNQDGIPTRNGNPWHRSVIWQILSNPAYVGKAAYRKTQAVPRKHYRIRPTGEKYPKVVNSSRRSRPESEWFEIRVPTIIDEPTFNKVKIQLEENKKFSSRNTKKREYLASGLLRCKECGYAYYGISRGTKRGYNLLYYRCHGTNSNRHAGGRKCWSKPVRVDILDDLVWNQAKQLIQDPQLVLNEYANRLNENKKGEKEVDLLMNRKRKELRNSEMEKERLLDLYQGGVLRKEELEGRLQSLRSKIKSICDEISLLDQEIKQKSEKLRLIERLEEFTKRLDLNLVNLTFEKRRELVRLLVSEVEIDRKNHKIDIRHIVPLSQNGQLCLNGGIRQGFARRS